MEQLTIRDAEPEDVAACAAIYGHFVRTTPATFELEPPTVDDVGRRIAACQASHAWLVAETDGAVTGFAYGTKFAERAAYRWSAEVSVYLDPATVGAGTGTALYDALLPRLHDRGIQAVFARIAQPNDASNALHARFGFRRVGLLERVGFKLGAWHDVAIMQRDLAPPATEPVEPH